MSALDWLDDALSALDRDDLRRHLRHHDGRSGPWLSFDGHRLLHLSGNNYLGLADDDRLVDAMLDAAKRHGVGAGASRLVTGGTDAHRELEQTLAQWKGTADAVVLSSGYLANLAVVTALVGRGDTVVSDALNHASIIDACRLSGAEVRVYAHGDAEHAERLLRDAPGRRLLVTDGVFSMDGDLAPLPALCDAAELHGAAVMVDDAHGSGVVGPDGRGTAAHLGCHERVDALVVTLSKSLGAAGGAILGSARLVDWVRNRARPFIFDTALPAPTAAAARVAIEISVAEPWRRESARDHACALADAVRGAGLELAAPDACIVPIVVGDNRRALRVMERLLRHDVLAVAIRPPSVPLGTARIRATVMATHTPADLSLAADAIVDALRQEPA